MDIALIVNVSAKQLSRFAHLAVKDKYMGRKKNEDRPIELQTSPINLRVTNEAREILDTISKYKRGKVLSQLITENKKFIIMQNQINKEI